MPVLYIPKSTTRLVIWSQRYQGKLYAVTFDRGGLSVDFGHYSFGIALE